jgi:hypothetical protein
MPNLSFVQHWLETVELFDARSAVSLCHAAVISAT